MIKRLIFYYLPYITGITTLIVGYFGISHQIKYSKKFNNQSSRLVRVTLNKLQKQQSKGDSKSGDNQTNSHVPISQLRDILLFDGANESIDNKINKTKLWAEVCRKVESNTNVRARQLEVHGEIMRVWEWVGDLSIPIDE